MNKIIDEFDKHEEELKAGDEYEKIEPKSIEQIQAESHLDAAIPDANDSTAQIEQPVSTNATDNLFGLLCLVPIALQFSGLKNTAAVWDEKNCRGLSEACIPVFRKYAWGGKIINFLETGAGIEEMALAAVCMPLAIATHSAFKKDTYTPPLDDENALKPNPTRASNRVDIDTGLRVSRSGIELANADDVDYDTRS